MSQKLLLMYTFLKIRFKLYNTDFWIFQNTKYLS